MTLSSIIPPPPAWASQSAQSASVSAACHQFFQCLSQIGFENSSYVHEFPRFEIGMPPQKGIFGWMISPEWMAHLRTMTSDEAAGYRVPQAASLGHSMRVCPAEDIRCDNLQAEERTALQLMQEFGLCCGWTFPIADRMSSTFSALLLDCRQDQQDQQALVDQHAGYLRSSFIYFREGLAVQQVLQEHTRNPLSPRESDCLAWTAAGKSAKEIASLIGIAESTVNEYIRNATRKLKATNRTQAAARAMLAGCFSL
jgi:DNA-binding CsgD family transcriptional regulator